MKLIRATALLSLVVIVTVLVFPANVASAAAAATTVTINITEAQINSSFSVTNPYRRTVSNLHVDLQNGQAAVSATITLPNKTSYNTVSIFTPNVTNGLLRWTLVSATVNGQALPAQVVTILNQAIYPNWRAVVSTILLHRISGPYKINSASLANDTLTLVITKGR